MIFKLVSFVSSLSCLAPALVIAALVIAKLCKLGSAQIAVMSLSDMLPNLDVKFREVRAVRPAWYMRKSAS